MYRKSDKTSYEKSDKLNKKSANKQTSNWTRSQTIKWDMRPQTSDIQQSDKKSDQNYRTKNQKNQTRNLTKKSDK